MTHSTKILVLICFSCFCAIHDVQNADNATAFRVHVWSDNKLCEVNATNDFHSNTVRSWQ